MKAITAAALCVVLTAALPSTFAQSAATVTIPADQMGAVVSSNLFGIFFEEINYAGDGGLYAEMVHNRSLYSATGQSFWGRVLQGTPAGSVTVDPTQPLNTNIPNSLKLTMLSGTGSVGAGNTGYSGMTFQSGATYYLNFFAMSSNGFTGPISAQLESANGSIVYAQASFGGLTSNWQRFNASLVSSGSNSNAQLVLSISSPATVWMDCISLFPSNTFFNRTNGVRLDLANFLAAMHPSFLRFPGGNFIEAYNLTNAVRWKKTIGDISLRPGHLDDAWGYWSTDGFGYHEFLQFCEDMGMQPIYSINSGLSLNYNGNTNNTVPLSQMGPWVQDALDAIEYANGDPTSTWGSLRAANGHPAPFNLQYMEIGNESGGSYYNDRYALFYDAIKSNYPSVHLIATEWYGSALLPTNRPVEIQDNHYYPSASYFITAATNYDGYNRSGPKVFIGEMAVAASYGTNGNLSAALGEAAFMTGLERNSDVVLMASYAPLLANVNDRQWHPDLINFDSARTIFGTPSYYVQEMFGQNRGDTVLPATVIQPGALLVSSTYSHATGQIIIKAVNPFSTSVAATFNITGVASIAPNGTVIQLTSAHATDENSLVSPQHVFPVTNFIANAGTNFTLTLLSNSLTILRLTPSGINSYTNLLLQLPSPIDNTQIVASSVSGGQSGAWFNLTANASHAIAWFSMNTNIASVDIYGNVTGVGSGTTSIIATYPSLGLSATQSVTVITIPATLMHRYSFSETDGTTVSDSIGGDAWNGTLPNGGAFGGGQLTLSSNNQQYVQLPAGILSNDTAITIESWATFPDQLAANCFFFGFGDTNAGVGENYICCVPQAGRIAIASASSASEQNVYGNIDFSSRTNLHLTAVFNPPLGYIAFYTNGVLAGSNTAVTTPFTSVNDNYSYIGRSLYIAAPYPDLILDEFRIYNGALVPDEIAATQVLGPGQLLSHASPTITASVANGGLMLSWPVASAGYTVLSAPDLSAPWTAITGKPQIVGGQWQIVLPVTNTAAAYYRLEE